MNTFQEEIGPDVENTFREAGRGFPVACVKAVEVRVHLLWGHRAAHLTFHGMGAT